MENPISWVLFMKLVTVGFPPALSCQAFIGGTAGIPCGCCPDLHHFRKQSHIQEGQDSLESSRSDARIRETMPTSGPMVPWQCQHFLNNRQNSSDNRCVYLRIWCSLNRIAQVDQICQRSYLYEQQLLDQEWLGSTVDSCMNSLSPIPQRWRVHAATEPLPRTRKSWCAKKAFNEQ